MGLLALFAVGAVFILQSTWPRTHRLDVRLPDRDGGVTAVHVEVGRDGEVLRSFDRRFPGESPPERVRFDVRLADGAYDVLVRTFARHGRVNERTLRLELAGDVVRSIDAR